MALTGISSGMRQRKCKTCSEWYQPVQSLQQVCSYHCAIERGKELKAKRKRKEFREAKQRLKPRSQWAREAQTAFNAFIRYRDRVLPCVSCGRFHDGQWHAGHYRTVGANPELRFDERNCHRQCAPCNNHKSGDIVNYRLTLIERIGVEAVELLEGPHEPKKYTIDDLKQIKAEYRDKLKELTGAGK